MSVSFSIQDSLLENEKYECMQIKEKPFKWIG